MTSLFRNKSTTAHRDFLLSCAIEILLLILTCHWRRLGASFFWGGTRSAR